MNTLRAYALATALLNVSTLALAEGDKQHGQELYESRCVACHSVDQNRVGPAHQGAYGRRAGRAPGYEYSTALGKSKVVWTERNLNTWLSNPEGFIPGQKMGFSVLEVQDRADLITYLKTLSISK